MSDNTTTTNRATGNGGARTAEQSSGTASSSRKKSVSVRRIVSRVLMPIRGCRIKRVNVIDQLRENDEEFSLLKLDASHTSLNYDRLVEAINNNSTVKNVQIHGGLVANMPLEEQIMLWEAIGRLPKLEEIHFKFFLEFPLMLECLNTVLMLAIGIKKVSIYDSVLYSRSQEDKLVSLEAHQNLKVVFMSQLRIPEGRVLDPIVAPLATAPALSNLTIRVPRKKKGMLTDKTLSLLTSSPSLKIMELRRLVLRDDQIIQIAKDLEDNTRFKEVTVQCDECLREECCTALGNTLKKNNSITRLEVWGQKVEEDGFCYVIDCLHQNSSLKVLHLSHDIGEKGNAALSKMLKNNFVMETLYMRSFGDPTMMARTDYYLKLNATGLRGLQLDINMDRNLLVDKLVKHMDDVNHLYFLLRGNPNFLDTPEISPGMQAQTCLRDGCQALGAVVEKDQVSTAFKTVDC